MSVGVEIAPALDLWVADVGSIFPPRKSNPYVTEADLTFLFLQKSTNTSNVFFESNLAAAMLKPMVVLQDSPLSSWTTANGTWKEGTFAGTATKFAEQVDASNSGVVWSAVTTSNTAYNLTWTPTATPIVAGTVITVYRGAPPRDSSHNPASNYTYIEFPYDDGAGNRAQNRFRLRYQYGQTPVVDVTTNGNAASESSVTWNEVGTLFVAEDMGKVKQALNWTATFVVMAYQGQVIIWLGQDLTQQSFLYDITSLYVPPSLDGKIPAVAALTPGTIKVSGLNGAGGCAVTPLYFQSAGYFQTFPDPRPPNGGDPTFFLQPGLLTAPTVQPPILQASIPSPVTGPYINITYQPQVGTQMGPPLQASTQQGADFLPDDPPLYQLQVNLGSAPVTVNGMSLTTTSPYVETIGVKFPGLVRQPTDIWTPLQGRPQLLQEQRSIDLDSLILSYTTVMEFNNRDQSMVGSDLTNARIFSPSTGAKVVKYGMGWTETSAFTPKLGHVAYRGGKGFLQGHVHSDAGEWTYRMTMSSDTEVKRLQQQAIYQMPLLRGWCIYAAVRLMLQYAGMGDEEMDDTPPFGLLSYHDDGPDPNCALVGGHPQVPLHFAAVERGTDCWSALEQLRKLLRAYMGFTPALDPFDGKPKFIFREFNWYDITGHPSLTYTGADGNAYGTVFKVLPDFDPMDGSPLLNQLLGPVDRARDLTDIVNFGIGYGWDFKTGIPIAVQVRLGIDANSQPTVTTIDATDDDQNPSVVDPTAYNYLGRRAPLVDLWSAYGDKTFVEATIKQEVDVQSKPGESLVWQSYGRPDLEPLNVVYVMHPRTVSPDARIYNNIDGPPTWYPVPYLLTDVINQMSSVTPRSDGVPQLQFSTSYRGIWTQGFPQPI